MAREVIDLFLCHTGADKDWVRILATRLEEEDHDGRKLRVFFDEWDIAPGENILERIEDGLRRARFVAVVISPAMTRAAWPALEWQTQVYEDPNGKRARVIPLIVRKFDEATMEPVDIPLPLRILRYLDFSAADMFPVSYELLLARLRGHRPGRGRGTVADAITTIGIVTGPEAPDPVDEALLANLFPAEIPPLIYSAPTSAATRREVWDAVGSADVAPFVLHGGRLYSFSRPGAGSGVPAAMLSGSSQSEPADSWLRQEDKSRLLVWLCNDALRQHCYSMRIRTPSGVRHQYYPPIWADEVRQFTWGKGKPITLAKVSRSGTAPLGVHRSARMRFIVVGERLYLLIEPGWFFTTDGVTPLDGRQVGVFSVKWGGREGNDTVLRSTLMWSRLLAARGDSIALHTGGAPIKVAVIPTHGRCNLGIGSDVINLDRVLSGDSAGEISETDELDLVASAHRAGAIEADNDDFRGQAADDGAEDATDLTSEPELPL
jgi:hypothetical protein